MSISIWLLRLVWLISPIAALREHKNLLSLKLREAEAQIVVITAERDEALLRTVKAETENEDLKRHIDELQNMSNCEERDLQRRRRLNYYPLDNP